MRKNPENPFKGRIIFHNMSIHSKKEKLLFKFDETPKKDLFNISEIIMNNFRKFNFSEAEKKSLSIKHRQLILQYQSIEKKVLEEYISLTIKKISNLKENYIRINASEFGAFICLATIFSGQLPKNKKVEFELSSVPIKLLPKDLVKDSKLSNAKNIIFSAKKENCWLSSLESLCPKELEVKNNKHYFKVA